MGNYFKGGTFTLSLLQLASLSVLLVVVTLFTYVIGFHAGREFGMLVALDLSESYMSKLPVEISSTSHQGLKEVASDIYAKLSMESYGDESDNKKNVEIDVAPLVPIVKEEEGGVDEAKDSVELKDTEPAKNSLTEKLRLQRDAHRAASSLNASESEKETTTPENQVRKVEYADLDKGWYVQVSAPALESDALSLSDKLRTSGFAVVIEKAKVQERYYYRVLVGPEETRLTSERMLQQLFREKYIDKSPFIRRVK
jgi:hypothetical protein